MRLALAVLLLLSAQAHAAPAPRAAWIDQGERLLTEGNALGFRVFVKKAYYRRLSTAEWLEVRRLVNQNADRVGNDLIQLWNWRNEKAKSTYDRAFDSIDALMLTQRYPEARTLVTKLINGLDQTVRQLARLDGPEVEQRRAEIRGMYPYAFEALGRALYSMGKFNESLAAFDLVSPSYPGMRQVLFEKMWAAFRAGKVEVALGAIASQRSQFFSRFLNPEAYLLQSYIYRKLCRKADLEQVVAEMRQYAQFLNSPQAFSVWAKSDYDTAAMATLASPKAALIPDAAAGITAADLERERQGIDRLLQTRFRADRQKLLTDLKTAIAYAQLATVSDAGTVLKPIEKLTDRETLLKQDLEVWPADSTEEWADEVGHHYFLGESECR